MNEPQSQQYRAVLYDIRGNTGHVKSIWFDSQEDADVAGRTGMVFYGANRYEIEPKLTGEGEVIRYEP